MQSTALSFSKADVVAVAPGTSVVALGKTLGVQPPLPNRTWHLEYNHDALKLMTPAADEEKPGERGWVWKAAVAGDYEIQMTSDAPCPTQPCAPNVARYTLTVSIK